MSITTTIKAGESGKTITLSEGRTLTLKGSAGSSGLAYLLDPVLGGTNSKQSWVIGQGALPPIGPYDGQQKVLVTCTAGVIDAVVGDAVLGAALQSNQLVGGIRGCGSNLNCTTASVASGSLTKCWGQAFSAWGPFHAVQLVYLNHTATPALIDNAIVGASASAFPSGVFNIARVPDSGWSVATGAVTAPIATGTDATSRGHQPGIVAGPKTPVRSRPRAAGELDGGKFELLVTRHLTLQGNATPCYADLGANFATLYDPVNEGFSILTTDPVFGTDCVANPTNWVSGPREAVPAMVCFGAIFYYDQKMISVCGVGDSIMGGFGDGGSQRAPYLFKATARIRATGKLCSYFNGGISGSKMSEINTHGKALISISAPDIMVLHSYTINSPIATQANWDDQWYYMMDLAQGQLAAGKQVLLLTPLPNDSFTTAQNAMRLTQRQRVLKSGLRFADVESLADGGGHWANSGATADGTHPLQESHERICSLVQPVLDTMIPSS